MRYKKKKKSVTSQQPLSCMQILAKEKKKRAKGKQRENEEVWVKRKWLEEAKNRENKVER